MDYQYKILIITLLIGFKETNSDVLNLSFVMSFKRAMSASSLIVYHPEMDETSIRNDFVTAQSSIQFLEVRSKFNFQTRITNNSANFRTGTVSTCLDQG